MAYDDKGFLKSRTVPATSDGQPATTYHLYRDALARVVKKEDPLGRRWTFEFDERDRLVSSTVPAVTAQFRQEYQGQRSLYNCYDRNDLLLSSSDLDGRQTQYGYDKAHRLIAVQEAGYPKPIRLKYDVMENLVQFTNAAGHSTRYQYDPLWNRSKKVTYPNGDEETFVYNGCSKLVEWNRGGQVITYDYDTLDRLTALHSPSTQDELSWSYDELSRVKKMNDGSGACTDYTYTANGLLKTITRSDGRGLTYNYDAGDRLQRLEDHEGDATDYRYNERNELLQVDYDGQTVSYGYDQVGRMVSTHLPNGIQSQRSYDQRNRLVYLHYQKASHPMLTYKYGHNQLGQRIVEEKISPDQNKLSRFHYNSRRELVKSDRLVNGCRTFTHYEYDLNHNRTKKNLVKFTHNGADQLTAYQGGDSLNYNPQGQVTRRGGFDFEYNHAQQIKRVQSGSTDMQYLYDGGGRRVAKVEDNGERTDYLLMGHEVLKTYENGNLRAKYFLGAAREGIQADGSWKWYLSDGLGSNVYLTDDSGDAVASWDYDDYGETTQILGDASIYNPFLYTGQEWDAEIGMYHLRARHYAPELGRFLARDPIGYSGGSNLYAYCAGDPINFVAPSGLAHEWYTTLVDLPAVSRGKLLIDTHTRFRSSDPIGHPVGSGATIVTRVMTMVAGAWREVGNPLEQNTGRMRHAEVKDLSVELNLWNHDGSPRYCAIKFNVELRGGARIGQLLVEYTLELHSNWKATIVPNDKQIRDIWRDQFRDGKPRPN